MRNLGPTVGELMTVAEEHGYSVTQSQIDRWHKHKPRLLPRRKQLHIPGVRGSEGRYPPEAVEQFLALCQFHKARKKLDEAGFWLWWHGYDVDPSWPKHAVLQVIGPVPEPPQLAPGQELFDLAEQGAEEAIATTSRRGFVHKLRRRLRNDADARSVIHTLILASLGEDLSWTEDGMDGEMAERGETSLQSLMFKGLGMVNSRSDRGRQALPSVPDKQYMGLVLDHLSRFGLWDSSGLVTLVEGLHGSDLARIREVWRVATQQEADIDGGPITLFAAAGPADLPLYALMLFMVVAFAFIAATLCLEYGLREARVVQRARRGDPIRWTRVLIRLLAMKVRGPDAVDLPLVAGL
jgi:hypothetical protein